MKRREFITLLGATAAGWPLAAHAQQSRACGGSASLVGAAEHDPQVIEGLAAFRTSLHELGWIEGRNIQIDTR